MTGTRRILRGIINNLTWHKQRVLSQNHEIHKLKTRTLASILDECEAPTYIDYMSMDIEGAEFEVLSTFPFDRYSFGFLSIEHNFDEPLRKLIREILENNGYKFSKSVKWDDWYERVK